MPERQRLEGYALACASVLLVSCAQLSQKWGMMGLPAPQGWHLVLAAPWPYRWALFAVCLGLVAYAVSIACWLRALDVLPLNRAYPVLGLSYVLVYLGGVTLPWYAERFSLLGGTGVVLIVLGVVLVNFRSEG